MSSRSGWIVGAAIVITACQSGASIGTSCTRAADCASALVCQLGRCRLQCVAARDCPAGQACFAPTPGAGSCELPAIDVCALSCDAPLVCVSGHCRQACSTDAECPSGHACVAHACERTDAMLDAGASPDAARIDANYGWACDPVADTGCPAGRRCGLLSGAPTCVASGSVALAGTCASEAECARGLTCQNRRCHALCYAGDRLACGPDVVCDALMLSFSDLPAAGLAYCTETCDPLAASNPACGPMTHCSLEVATASRGYTFCVGLGTHLEGDLCGGQSDCADGLACAYDGGRCRAFCDPSAPSACPIGRTCQPALMLSARTIGVCLP